MDKKKQVGVLCPVSALPSRYGIGDFGKEAYEFVDELAKSKMFIWQILPLNPLGFGNSPYQPLSSYAGDEIYISIDGLMSEHLLSQDDIDFDYTNELSVHYDDVREKKERLYRKAFSHFTNKGLLKQFMDENPWVKDYALFRVFKKINHNKSWVEWRKQYKDYQKYPSLFLLEYSQEVQYQVFLQYSFFLQWKQLKAYANQKGLTIIGDMPIYVGLDSVDVWTHQDSFLLDDDGFPTSVAGVPPDYFSQYGQRWGNPIYNWEYLQAHDFSFWVNRMKAAYQIYDTVRIDHFRAFDTYWQIPATEPTAVIGKWIEAPGYQLFDTLFQQIPHLSILAEDLGELRNEVYDLRDHYHLKGMYVFQFHYDCEFDFEKVIVYTGTHDNDTLVGWLAKLSEEDHIKIDKLLEKYSEDEDYLKIIHYCLDLPTTQVIFPIWDILGLDNDYRFNQPGVIGSPNWEMRLTSLEAFKKQLALLTQMGDF